MGILAMFAMHLLLRHYGNKRYSIIQLKYVRECAISRVHEVIYGTSTLRQSARNEVEVK